MKLEDPDVMRRLLRVDQMQQEFSRNHLGKAIESNQSAYQRVE